MERVRKVANLSYEFCLPCDRLRLHEQRLLVMVRVIWRLFGMDCQSESQESLFDGSLASRIESEPADANSFPPYCLPDFKMVVAADLLAMTPAVCETNFSV